jgi:excisionase family DNA binding protein
MDPTSEPGAWLSPQQAASRLGLSTDRVQQLADSGRLPCVRTALGRLLRASDVERLAAERADRGPRDPLPAA